MLFFRIVWFFFLTWNLHRIHSFSRAGRWKDQLYTWNLDNTTLPRYQLCNMLCMSHKYIYPFVFNGRCDFSTQWHTQFCEGVFPSFPSVPSGRAWGYCGVHIYNSHQGTLGLKNSYLNTWLWLKSVLSVRGMFSHFLTRTKSKLALSWYFSKCFYKYQSSGRNTSPTFFLYTSWTLWS